MTQLKFDYGAYATVSYNPERRRNASPQPDRDGLFDVEGVTVICLLPLVYRNLAQKPEVAEHASGSKHH